MTVLVALAVSAAVIALLVHRAAFLPQDAPNARSLHGRTVPRGGGLAILAGIAAALAIDGGPSGSTGPTWLACLLVASVSFVDDHRSVSPWWRLPVHLAAAAVAAVSLLAGESGAAPVLAVCAAALAIAWSANLFNFMDGSDGLAASMALVGFGAYALAGLITVPSPFEPAAAAAAVVPFLWRNRPPARLFMGDVGAVPLGFLAAAAGLDGVLRGAWPAWFPLLAFLPFLADATWTLGRRAWRRERVWQAHREHYYQRYVRLGGGHAGVLRLYAVLMAGSSASALAALALEPRAGWTVLGAWCAVVAVVFSRIDYHWRRRAPGST